MVPVPDIPQLKNRKPGAEYALRVSYKLKKDTDWAKKGYELAFDQLQLPVQGGLPMFTAPAGKVTLGADKHTVSGKDFTVQFDPATGELSQFTVNGKPLFKTPMAVNALRAASSNEPGVMSKSMANGLRQLKQEVVSYEAIDNGSSVTVKQSVKVSGVQAEKVNGYGDTKTTITPVKEPLNDANTHFINNQEWTIYADGTVVCQSVLLPRGNPLELLRLGYEFQFPRQSGQRGLLRPRAGGELRGPQERDAAGRLQDHREGLLLSVRKAAGLRQP